MRIVLVAFGAMLALLFAVALSVPAGPGATPGSSITMLQLYGPFVGIAGCFVIVLVIIIKWLLKDRQREREAFVTIHRDTNVTHQKTVTTISLQHQASVQAMVEMGAMLVVTATGRPAAQLPGGPALTISSTEAEYWKEIAPDTVAGYLPGRRTER